MPDRVLRTQNELEDFVRGCALLGTGGGGDPATGLQLLVELLEEGKEIGWVDATRISGNGWVCCPFYMGSIAPHTDEVRRKLKALGLKRKVKHELVEAVRELEQYTGYEILGLASAEMGGINTPAPLAASVRLGIPLVDGDYGGGRAIPEIAQSLTALHYQDVCPIAFVDYSGTVTILKQATSYAMVERVGKMISRGPFSLIGSAGFLLRGEAMREVISTNTLTRALELGGIIRTARDSGSNIAAKVAAHLSGWVLARGTVVKREWEDRDGYMFGEFRIEGTNEFSGEGFRVWYQNENHLMWRGDRPIAMSPDIIAVMDAETGEPVTNTSLRQGDRIAVIGAVGSLKYRSDYGLEILGPRHYGFDLDYIPIEVLQG